MKAHLAGLAVPVWTSLPLRRAERGHAELTVNDRAIVQRFTARASRLQGGGTLCYDTINTEDSMNK